MCSKVLTELIHFRDKGAFLTHKLVVKNVFECFEAKTNTRGYCLGLDVVFGVGDERLWLRLGVELELGLTIGLIHKV